MRGLRKLERRRKAGFEFVQEGVFQKLAETQRLKVRCPAASICPRTMWGAKSCALCNESVQQLAGESRLPLTQVQCAYALLERYVVMQSNPAEYLQVPCEEPQ